jgi:hypothetical protein
MEGREYGSGSDSPPVGALLRAGSPDPQSQLKNLDGQIKVAEEALLYVDSDLPRVLELGSRLVEPPLLLRVRIEASASAAGVTKGIMLLLHLSQRERGDPARRDRQTSA